MLAPSAALALELPPSSPRNHAGKGRERKPLPSMQTTPSASYSLTLRVKLSSRAGTLGELTTAIGRAGGDIGAIDIVNVGNDYIIRDITVSSASSKHAEQIVQAVRDVDGVELVHVSDPTF